jgi:hypothetical protein
VSNRELDSAIDAALRAVNKALARQMHTARGEPAVPQLEQLRAGLLAMANRDVVDSDELRTMIRSVADWAPEDDVSLLGSLGVIARLRGRATDGAQ